MRTTILSLTALVAALAAGAAAQDAPTAAFDVRVELYDGDVLVGRPILRVTEGAPAQMMMDQPGGYRLSATVRRAAPGSDRFVLDTETAFRDADGWRPAHSLSFSGALGGVVSGQVGAAPPQAGYRIVAQVDVAPVDVAQADLDAEPASPSS